MHVTWPGHPAHHESCDAGHPTPLTYSQAAAKHLGGFESELELKAKPEPQFLTDNPTTA